MLLPLVLPLPGRQGRDDLPRAQRRQAFGGQLGFPEEEGRTGCADFFCADFFSEGVLEEGQTGCADWTSFFLVLFEGALEEGRFVVLFLARHLEKLEII